MLDDRRRKWFDGIVWTAATVYIAMLVDTAQAADHRYPVDNATYQSECGSCHVAYPARLLPAESWRRIIAGLSAHFGADASLDADSAAAIEHYLTSSARRPRRKESTTPLRITETTWFRHEHDEVPHRWWDSPAVRGPSDCGACHTKADRGQFGESGIRRPK